MNEESSTLDFITTYGWAFLLILCVIGALAYLGVLKDEGCKCISSTCELMTNESQIVISCCIDAYSEDGVCHYVYKQTFLDTIDYVGGRIGQ